ncbi:hypothetical protein [Planktothrix sp. FACHB-1365]|uniref:hypothetical protein n=1 Tax=Planktothrix sp. FACHB-1365 TaxID=2692855 RepID=UPI0016850ECD|nr:hypothetical protein [Planktothrix sp. FACHB-1365]MBD2480833.1 hypothetical protein [Planktothrix sp. FACHB-1365]
MCSQHDNNQSQQPDSNSQQDSWENWISNLEQNHKEIFQWLLVQFNIQGWETWLRKKQLLEEAITNPEKLLGLLSTLRLDIEQLEQGLKQSLDGLQKEKPDLFNWLINLFDVKEWQKHKQPEALANTIKDTRILFEVFAKIQKNDLSLSTEIDQLQKTKPQLFQWLLQRFGINGLYPQAENLEKKMRDHKVVFEVFAQLSQLSVGNYQQQQSCRQEIEYLERQNRYLFITLLRLFEISEQLHPNKQKQQLETKLLDPILSVQAFSTFSEHYNKLNAQLQDTKNSENAMRQDLEKLRQERRSVSYYEEKVQELEAENEALKKRSGEMFATLSKQHRNETTTITSDDSRRQRDTLISEFKTLSSQDFKRITVQIFNHLTSINHELQNNRKQEEAKIRSILSQRIFESEINWIKQNNSVSSESNLWTMKAKEITQLITQDLFQQSTNNIPKEIIESLESLTQKGLKLVKDIINDQPPGELWIEPKDKNFNPDKHEPMIGCEADGVILYTTYPGYRTGSRILEKAIVFTVPKQEINPSTKDIETTPNTNQINTGSISKISASQKVQVLNDKGMTDDDIAKKLEVTPITVSNWKKALCNPSTENAEKLDQLYQEVCGQSSNLYDSQSENEERKVFSGIVKNRYGVNLYKTPKQTDIDIEQKINYGDRLIFDMLEKTQNSPDKIWDEDKKTTDDIWLRVVDKNYWIPRAYIRLDQ